MATTVTGVVELGKTENPGPPPAFVRTVTIRGRRSGDEPVVFTNLPAEWWEVFQGNAGSVAVVTYETEPTVRITAAAVR